MSTAHVERGFDLTSINPSFTNFRRQFGDGSLAASLHHPQAAEIANQEMESRPPTGQTQVQEITPAIAPLRSGQQDTALSSSETGGFGTLELVELASNPILEGTLGPNKDGRVRNPVPSKLKGKTDNKKGNFGVMHMGASPAGKKNETPGRDAAAERDAAARRTSENTASRAKAAQQEKYVPPKKRGLEAALTNDAATNRASPFGGRDDQRQRARPLTPDETKYEQARLLTLLRSINPMTVVDQLCKAVAYFGGIPGAPPPEDGIFPESANTRETGALFIGWLSEIFPDLDRVPDPPRIQEAPMANNKRGRGRPSRGGKSSTPIPEKEPPNSANGFGYGPALSAPTWGLPASVTLVNTHPPISAPQMHPPNQSYQQNMHAQSESPSTPIKQQQEDLQPDANSTSKRRRGRPKGSRNKGRNDQSGDGVGDSDMPGQSSTEQQGYQASMPQEPQEQSTLTKPSPVLPIQKPKPPILPPQKPKPAQTLTYSQQYQTESNQQTAPQSAFQLDEYSPEERAVVEAFRNPQQPTASMAYNVSPVVTTAPPAAPAGGAKRKRAPPKPKNIPVSTTPIPVPQMNIQAGQMQSTPNPTPLGPITSPVLAKDNLQWAPVDTTATAPPPAKRQRKPKSSGNDAPSRKKTISTVSSATPPISASTLPDSQATSQHNIPVTRPQAEGLEARVQHFANFQQQNGRSITPSTTPQQQLRQQHQKSASISLQPGQQQVSQQPSQQVSQQVSQTPQQVQQAQQVTQQVPQAAPQVTQQQSKQQPSVQQSSTRDDQKMTASRSSSTFYNPRNQVSNYTQQYPSQQATQQYSTHQASPQLTNAQQTSQQYTTHQPSPQMSNSSYRTGSAHTLTQASPQFSQTDTNYRTASPHISQPSPSFSQTDNYRTSSSLAQPTPSYAQGDNTYRTAGQHILAQPSPSFSQPETTYKAATQNLSHAPSAFSAGRSTQNQSSHQSHYNHFSDTSLFDLPTLESLGHSGGAGAAANVSISSGPYSQQSLARSTGGTNSIYGTSGIGNAFDITGGNDLLRTSRTGSNANSNGAYGSTSGIGGGFGTDISDNEMRERLMRNLGGGRR